MTLSATLRETEKRQQHASDPAVSAWVSASAGTGKTKVLTDRVLRLLLEGVPPQRVLCLTFTRAAASEMANRLNQRLVAWVTATDARLTQDLKILTGSDVNTTQLTQARCLLARVLDAPGGMRIQTIHSFCESLLGRFPLEANVPPHFSVMDDRGAVDLLEAARDTLLNSIQNNDGSDLGNALRVIALNTREAEFRDLIAQLISDRTRLARVLEHEGLTGIANRVRATFSLSEADTPKNIMALACVDVSFDLRELNKAAEAMAVGKITDRERASRIKSWISKSPKHRVTHFDNYCRAFLTTSDRPLSRLVTRSIQDEASYIALTLKKEQNRIVRVREKHNKAILAECTISLLTVAAALISAYEKEKTSNNLLDYDDLILKSKNLLHRPSVMSWVLYKLDGGIDHILIDEAQDTNPDQWEVVQALSEEFFSGVGAREENRTLFAVGDTKQSIYSFQRADPTAFNQMREFFRSRVMGTRAGWNDIQLDISFRSSAAVLEAVDLVFSDPVASDGVVEPETGTQHLPARNKAAGLVEVWPLVVKRLKTNSRPWAPPTTRVGGEPASKMLARMVAAKIKLLCSGETLESQGRLIRPGDIMVLVRRRNSFIGDLVKALKINKIPVSGVDRLILTDHIAVKDLISLGRFLLLPDDDLSLAEVLKSPLCGMDDEDLFTIGHKRRCSLWRALLDHGERRLEFSEAKHKLTRLLEQADEKSPYDLYAELLSKGGGRQAFRAHLGDEALDPLDEFLTQALSYQSNHVTSLQGFIDWLTRANHTVNRDLSQAAADAVRILTVHGAKGLEAPIVFLPDTVQVPNQTPRLLWSKNQQCMIWAARKKALDTVTKTWATAAEKTRDQEYRRLLYVAMTRAEDRLYVCGWTGEKTASRASWYKLIYESLKTRAKCESEEFLTRHMNTTGETLLRLVCPQTEEPQKRMSRSKNTVSSNLPNWAHTSPSPETVLSQHLTPHLFLKEGLPKPHSIHIDDKLQTRGKLIHSLLQWLPNFPPEIRTDKLRHFLSNHTTALSDTMLSDLSTVALKVVSTPELAHVFGSESRAEVPLTGSFSRHGRTYNVLTQIHRLTVKEKTVSMVVFATEKHVPQGVFDVPIRYLRHMATCRVLLETIYPAHAIECTILWTEIPRLMVVDKELLDRSLP